MSGMPGCTTRGLARLWQQDGSGAPWHSFATGSVRAYSISVSYACTKHACSEAVRWYRAPIGPDPIELVTLGKAAPPGHQKL